MISLQLLDGQGEGHVAHVTKQNALLVTPTVGEVPPFGESNRLRYLSGILGTTGLDSGTTDQSVNGSGTPVEFYINSSPDYDIRVMGILIVIVDSAVSHEKFGDIAALGTGWDLFITESGESTYLIEKAQTGGEVILQSGLARPYGDGDLTFELTKFTGATDAQTIYIPISEYIPAGLRIGRGTQDRISAVVNDNLTGLTTMYVRIFGYKHFP